jgi:hypothetical protein
MGLLNLFKKKDNKSTSIIEESFIKSDVIYNSYDTCYILISFSKDKLNDAVEFMSDINKIPDASSIHALYRHSSYEEETELKDDKGYSIYNVYERYYILISGTDIGFAKLIKYSDNLANEIIESIMNDISNNRLPHEYKELIEDNIFMHKFVYNANEKNIKFEERSDLICIGGNDIFYDNIKAIKSKLPKCFTMQSIISVVMARLEGMDSTIKGVLKAYYNLINENTCDIHDFKMSFAFLLDVIIPSWNNNDDILMSKIGTMIGPQYMVPDDDTDDGVSDAEIDEIFKEKYERFVGLIDDTVEYEDIDEQLSKEPIIGDEE